MTKKYKKWYNDSGDFLHWAATKKSQEIVDVNAVLEILLEETINFKSSFV